MLNVLMDNGWIDFLAIQELYVKITDVTHTKMINKFQEGGIWE